MILHLEYCNHHPGQNILKPIWKSMDNFLFLKTFNLLPHNVKYLLTLPIHSSKHNLFNHHNHFMIKASKKLLSKMSLKTSLEDDKEVVFEGKCPLLTCEFFFKRVAGQTNWFL